MLQPRVTLRDIAIRAGVSTAAVSMALRNSPEISVRRRHEIKRLAEQMGYRPDPSLMALTEYRHQRRKPKFKENLAFLYQTADSEPLESWSDWPVRRELLQGIRERAIDLGYGLEIHDLGTEAGQQKRLASMLRTRGIRGLLVHANLQAPEKVFGHLRAFAALNILQFTEKPTFHSIRNNDYESMRLALKNSYKLGYRSPLYLCNEARYGLFGPETMGGFDWFAKTNPDVHCRSLSFSEFRAGATEILKTKPGVDVILTHDYRAVEKIAMAAGFTIPEDCGVCYLFASNHLPGYAGMNIQAGALGKSAVERVDLMLRHHDLGRSAAPTTLLLHPRWQNGPSLPRRRPVGGTKRVGEGRATARRVAG